MLISYLITYVYDLEFSKTFSDTCIYGHDSMTLYSYYSSLKLNSA